MVVCSGVSAVGCRWSVTDVGCESPRSLVLTPAPVPPSLVAENTSGVLGHEVTEERKGKERKQKEAVREGREGEGERVSSNETKMEKMMGRSSRRE